MPPKPTTDPSIADGLSDEATDDEVTAGADVSGADVGDADDGEQDGASMLAAKLAAVAKFASELSRTMGKRSTVGSWVEV